MDVCYYNNAPNLVQSLDWDGDYDPAALKFWGGVKNPDLSTLTAIAEYSTYKGFKYYLAFSVGAHPSGTIASLFLNCEAHELDMVAAHVLELVRMRAEGGALNEQS